MPADDNLSDAQRLFVQYYLKTLNATEAAKLAGYSEKTADRIGHQLMQKPAVKRAIKQAMDRRARRLEIDADRVLEELAAIGFASMGDFASWGPKGVKIKDSRKLDTRAVQGISEGTNGQKTIKLHDKLEALKHLAQHLGLLRNEPPPADPTDPLDRLEQAIAMSIENLNEP
jgi:phage terminase small subunit